MEFKKELQALTENFDSQKLNNVKIILKKAASNGENSVTIDEHIYDEWVVSWLKNEGFNVSETNDQRQGSFLRINW